MSTLLPAPLSSDVPMMVRAHVAEWSARMRRPDDWIVGAALTSWLAQQATRRRQTLSALAEVGQADATAHHEVQAWVAGLLPPDTAPRRPATAELHSALRWTRRSTADLAEVHRLLKEIDAGAAVAVLRTLLQAVQRLVDDFDAPEPLDEFQPHDVRQVSVGRFDIRVAMQPGGAQVLRVWSTTD